MKFWELTSAFREEPNILLQVLNQDKWAKYYNNYKRLVEIVKNKERDILDEELPFDLAYEVADKSVREYWLAFDKQPQTLYKYKPDIDNLERLLPSEILVRFGGDKIEDAHERSSTNVYPKPLDNNIEIIGSYDLSSRGLLSILRTAKDILAVDSILSGIKVAKYWKVKGEVKQFADPYSAYEKLQAQKKQNIRHYFLEGVGHNDKPKPGDFLQISNRPK